MTTEKPYLTVKIDIGEAARRVLIEHARERLADLEKIQRAVAEAQEHVERFAWSVGILNEVKLVSPTDEGGAR